MRLTAAVALHGFVFFVLLRNVTGWWLPVVMGTAGAVLYFVYPSHYRRTGLPAWLVVWFGVPLVVTILERVLS